MPQQDGAAGKRVIQNQLIRAMHLPEAPGGLSRATWRPYPDSAYRVRLTLPDGFERWYFVNTRTFRIDRARDTRELHANDGHVRAIETVFTDYREVNRYWFPFTVFERDVGTGEQLSGRTILGIWPNVPVPDSLFAAGSRSDPQRVTTFRAKIAN